MQPVSDIVIATEPNGTTKLNWKWFLKEEEEKKKIFGEREVVLDRQMNQWNIERKGMLSLKFQIWIPTHRSLYPNHQLALSNPNLQNKVQMIVGGKNLPMEGEVASAFSLESSQSLLPWSHPQPTAVSLSLPPSLSLSLHARKMREPSASLSWPPCERRKTPLQCKSKERNWIYFLLKHLHSSVSVTL